MDLVLMGLALGYYSQSVAITPGAASSLGIKPLQLCGREDQKQAHLPELAAGKRMFAFGLSEPGRGSMPPTLRCGHAHAGWLAHAGGKMLDHERQMGQPYHCACYDYPRGTPRPPLYLLHCADGRPPCALPGNPWQAGLEAVLYGRHCARPRRSTDSPPRGKTKAFGSWSPRSTGDACSLRPWPRFLWGVLWTAAVLCQERLQFANQPIGRFQRVQDVLLDMDIALEQGLVWLLHWSGSMRLTP